MSKQAHIVVGLGYGDEGKGTTVQHLAHAMGAQQVVRFNGGRQAAHNVIAADGRHHTFNSFGSASFEHVPTHLAAPFLLDPIGIFEEAAALQSKGLSNVLDGLSIDANCLIVTPYHIAANRLREIGRGAGAHGSCGLGIGETQADALNGFFLRARDLHRLQDLQEKLTSFAAYKKQSMQYVNDIADTQETRQLQAMFDDKETLEHTLEIYSILAQIVPMIEQPVYADKVVFEGAQGVLLDENYGFHPHTTWSTTMPTAAKKLLADSGWRGYVQTTGVLRSYMTRHGAGPMVTETTQVQHPEHHNQQGRFQGQWRQGHADMVMARYAATAADIDTLAVTHVDMDNDQVCMAYEIQGKTYEQLPVANSRSAQIKLTQMLGKATPIYRQCSVLAQYRCLAPIVTLSYGPTMADKTTMEDDRK